MNEPDIARALRSLPVMVPPKALDMRLRVVASQQMERNSGRAEFSTVSRRWWMRAKLMMRDLMRPLAVPAAGGLLSSVVCFTVLAGTFALPQQFELNDVPIGFTTQVSVDALSPFGYTGHDVTIELSIDKQGKVSSYSAHGSLSRDDVRQLGNLILFTSFAPARYAGSPTSGKVLLSSHRINVRG